MIPLLTAHNRVPHFFPAHREDTSNYTLDLSVTPLTPIIEDTSVADICLPRITCRAPRNWVNRLFLPTNHSLQPRRYRITITVPYRTTPTVPSFPAHFPTITQTFQPTVPSVLTEDVHQDRPLTRYFGSKRNNGCGCDCRGIGSTSFSLLPDAIRRSPESRQAHN